MKAKIVKTENIFVVKSIGQRDLFVYERVTYNCFLDSAMANFSLNLIRNRRMTCFECIISIDRMHEQK